MPDNHKQKEEERCERDLPVIDGLAKTLINVGLQVDSAIGKWHHDDHFGFLLILHYRKQIEHLNSIIKLEPSRDVALIARSMLEGVSQLYFVFQQGEIEKIQEKALRFRQFAAIHDWREMKKLEEIGDPLKPEMQEEIKKNVAEVGEFFYNEKALSAIRKGKKLPDDPYFRDWHGHGATRLMESLEASGQHGDIFTQFWARFSEYHHWNTAGLGVGVSWKENVLNVTTISNYDSVISMLTGIGCLLYTIDGVLLHFEKETPGKVKPQVELYKKMMHEKLAEINFGERTE